MTLLPAHQKIVDNKFNDGGFEILIGWIVEDFSRNLTSENIHDFYIDYTFGGEKLTEDQFFLAYKSAELVKKDIINFDENRKSKMIFRRAT